MSTDTAIQSPETAWVKLWHPRGVDVRLPIHVNSSPVPADCWRAVMASVTNALEAGWLIEAPGMEEGEHKEMIGWVARKQTDEGTPVIDLYVDNEQLSFKYLTVYLNRSEDVAAFERASGLKLESIPLYVGAGHLERGASKQTDAMITRAPRPFAVASKANPRHDPNETDMKKMKPKRLFSRWPDLLPEAKTVNPEPKARDTEAENFKALEGVVTIAKLREWHAFALQRPADVSQLYMRAIRDRAAHILLEYAMKATTDEERSKVEDESRNKMWNLTPDQVRDIDQQLSITKFAGKPEAPAKRAQKVKA